MTVLWFAPNPARWRCSINRTSGYCARTASAEPSSDALSSTTISASTPRNDSRHASSSSREFVLTSEIETSGTQLDGLHHACRPRGRKVPQDLDAVEADGRPNSHLL